MTDNETIEWNVEDVAFLHPPDTFTGTFGNEKMQERHEQQLQVKLDGLKNSIAAEPDPFKAMKKLHKRDHFQFFWNNRPAFHGAGRFEEALLGLYCRRHGPFSSGGDIELWAGLFEECERTKLYDLGEPITLAAATVYRGSTMGPKRSLSWSLDKERALWFAERWDDPVGGGPIYELDITRKHMLIRVKKSRESEVIIEPSFMASADIRPFEP